MRPLVRLALPIFTALTAVLIVVVSDWHLDAALAEGSAYVRAFVESPATPLPFQPTDWDLAIHSRDPGTWQKLEPMQAQHGADCGPPPATHPTSSYEDAVFLCKNHLMTAISAGGYGVIYMTPNQLVDFSQGEAVVHFDMSTLRTSTRDWVDLWVTPFDENLQLPLESFLPDLDGAPRHSVHLRMDNSAGGTIFNGFVVRDFRTTDVPGNWFTGYESFLSPSATRRDTFELRISRTHLKFGMPQYNFWWIDTNIADLGWTQGVLQLGHHSYTPDKGECLQGGCGPDTWHWSNIGINPAVPFTILRADHRFIDATTSPQLNFPSASPSGAHLRFSAIGSNVQVSFDNGQTWQSARVQPAEAPDTSGTHFQSYWTDMPSNVQSVMLRAQNTRYVSWAIKDVSVWVAGAAQGAAQPDEPPPTVPAVAAPSVAAAASANRVPPTSSQTVTFDGSPGVDEPLNGEYPSGDIDWGRGRWYVSSPWGAFTGKSISFNGPRIHNADFKLLTPQRLARVDAYNGGSEASTLTLSCDGQPTTEFVIEAGALRTLETGWTDACQVVTVGSANGWETNLNNLVLESP